MNKALKIVPSPVSDAKSDRPALQGRIVHGYDSDELFREDLWLRRIEHSRKQLVAPVSMRLVTRSEGVGEEDIRAGIDVTAMHGLDRVRGIIERECAPGEVERPGGIGGRIAHRLQLRAHAAVHDGRLVRPAYGCA